jgi:hypothetical protein
MVNPTRESTSCKYRKFRNANLVVSEYPRNSIIFFIGTNAVLSPRRRFTPTKFPSKPIRGHPLRA